MAILSLPPNQMSALNKLLQTSDPANEILPGLWLGNRVAALDQKFLEDNKIRAVFNCTKDIPFHFSVVRRYRLPVDDNLQMAEIRNMELWSFEVTYKIAHELRRARQEGGAILVHCAAGMQRSAAACAMYCIASQNASTDQAIEFIQSKRPIAFRPKANFEQSIRGFETAYNRDIRPHLS